VEGAGAGDGVLEGVGVDDGVLEDPNDEICPPTGAPPLGDEEPPEQRPEDDGFG